MLGALVGVVSAVAHGQDRAPTLAQLEHTAWSVRDGIAGPVYALAQATDGALWIGTQAGLYRYDGVRFEPFQPPPGAIMPSLGVTALLALPDGALWIGYAHGGASVLARGRLTTFGEADGFPRGGVTSFARDSSGAVWSATTGGLARYAVRRWERFDTTSGFPGGLTADLLVDGRGALWAGTASGVFVLPRDGRRFARQAPSLDDHPPAGGGMLRQAPDGAVWGASMTRGLVQLADPAGRPVASIPRRGAPPAAGLLIDRRMHAWLSGRDGSLTRVALRADAHETAEPVAGGAQTLGASSVERLSGRFVIALLQDREGNVWAGTDGGLDRFRETKLTPVVWPWRVVFPALAAGDGGIVWAGSYLRPVVAIADRVVPHPDGPARVRAAYRDLNGGVWLAGPSGLWRAPRDRSARFEHIALPGEAARAEVQSLARDTAGDLWVSVAIGKGVYRRHGAAWAPFHPGHDLDGVTANVITADSGGRTWLGYNANRVLRVAGGSSRLYEESDGLHVGTVTAIHARGDRLWVAGDFGVALLAVPRQGAELTGARFRPLNLVGGIVRGVTGIVETRGGDLWLNGADGVTRVPASEVARAVRDSAHPANAERFGVRDGLDAVAPNVRPVPSAIEGTDGRLWFSLVNGAVWVDPARIRRNLVPPPVEIRAVIAAERRYVASGRVTLPARTTALQIAYSALSLGVPERVRFRYRLVGLDTAWQDAGARRDAFYTNLGPGAYRFRVIASNDDGVWNETGAALDVVIPPTFVETDAFRVLCALAASALAWALVQWRHRRAADALRARFAVTLAERTRIARELHDTLLQGFTGVTLQVHAARAIVHTRPDDASEALERAEGDAHATLREARRMVGEMRAPALDGADLVDAVTAAARDAIGSAPIAIGVVVRGDRRRVSPDVEATAARIVREAVRNAVRDADPRAVDVTLAFEAARLTLSVQDDGRGFAAADLDAARHDGHWGIVGMRERATQVGGRLDIRSTPDAGTRVTVVLPIA